MTTQTPVKERPISIVWCAIQTVYGQSDLAFSGPGLLGVGIWLTLVTNDVKAAIDHAQYALPMYMLLAAGGATIVIGILGCVAIFNENRCLLSLYFLLLAAVLATEVTVCLKSFLIFDGIKSHVNYNLNISIQYKYIYDEDVTKSIDTIQQEFNCCGLNSPNDWYQARYNVEAYRSLVAKGTQPYPTSCCENTSNCDLTISAENKSAIFKTGCMVPVSQRLQLILRIIGWATLGSSSLIIVGAIMVCCFRIAVT